MSVARNDGEASETAADGLARIWLVDDEKASRETVLVRQADMKCTQRYDRCEDALQALVDGKRPEVILFGLHLPGTSVLEGIRRIKDVLPEIEMLVFSNPEDNETVSDAICAGASGYLLRSSSMEDLPDGIRETLSGSGPTNFPDVF